MLANQDFDVHPEIARPPKNFDYASRRRHAAARKTRQLHVDDGAIKLYLIWTAVEARVSVIHQGVGGITENDIMLASASNAMVVGFNVRPNAEARSGPGG